MVAACIVKENKSNLCEEDVQNHCQQKVKQKYEKTASKFCIKYFKKDSVYFLFLDCTL